MKNWKTHEIWSNGEKKICRWIKIICCFLQGGSYSLVAFYFSEISVRMLLQESKGYQIGELGSRYQTHAWLVCRQLESVPGDQ